MKLKNILLVVRDIERSKRFYQELFGLQVIRDFGENVILSEGLVLQSAYAPENHRIENHSSESYSQEMHRQKLWEPLIKEGLSVGNASELFFEDNDLDRFLLSMENYPEKITIVGDIRENSWGKRAVILKDPDGHIIEVAESR